MRLQVNRDGRNEVTGQNRSEMEPQPGSSRQMEGAVGGALDRGMDDEQRRKEIAKKMVIDAEKFQASVDRPNGRNVYLNSSSQNANVSVMPKVTIDDEFFHLMCHVDPNLIPKIENGEFVDLEKLLPHDPTRSMLHDGRLELVNHDGVTYFMPASDRDTFKINGIRRWEQAFRVYAAIYSNANPQRSAEIWQYVYIINLAVNSFSWDNVACYDYVFRQLMARHPD